MKKLTVTIGIPAYNEERNIGKLLDIILKQKEDIFVLKKIIVISDQSTDNTDKVVKNVKDKRILLISNKDRVGQAKNQNKIFSLATTDVVVLFEADTLPEGKDYMSHLLSKLNSNKTIGLVQGYDLPLPAKTLVGKVFETQFSVYYNELQKSQSLLRKSVSGRGGRAFTKNLYQQLTWPSNVPEDVYALMWCNKHKVNSDFEIHAVCRYRSPQIFSDFIKESKKIEAGKESLLKYFDEKEINERYYIPLSFYIKCFAKFLIRFPIDFLIYIPLRFALITYPKKPFRDVMLTTITTKQL